VARPGLAYDPQRCLNATGPWVVHNFADASQGTMSLLRATALSVNTIYAQLALRVGPACVVDVAHRMGIESPLKPVCSITLGPEAVSPLEMTVAFSMLVDFKATSTTSIVSRAGLWQIAGYALADADDQYGIRRVGIAALRWRGRWTIDLDELLERLAGQRLTRGEARAEFAEATRPVAGRRRLRRRSPRARHGGDASQRFD
jgi:hypothetical protein